MRAPASVAWDPHHRLSDGQRLAKGQKVRTVAAELRELADASETRMVRYAEYAALKDRLYAFGLSLTPTLDQGVATAIHRRPGAGTAQGQGMAQGVVIPSGGQIHRTGELVGVPRTHLAVTAGVGSAAAVRADPHASEQRSSDDACVLNVMHVGRHSGMQKRAFGLRREVDGGIVLRRLRDRDGHRQCGGPVNAVT